MLKFEAEDEARARARLNLPPMRFHYGEPSDMTFGEKMDELNKNIDPQPGLRTPPPTANTPDDIPNAAVKFDADKPAYHLLDREFVSAMSRRCGSGGNLNDALLELRSWAAGESNQLPFAFTRVAGAFNTIAPWLTAELEIARVLALGARKYAPHNWRKGFAWSRLYRAAVGHIRAHQRGDVYDPETGLLHLSHALCMLMFLVVHERDELGTDDRGEMIR